MPSALADALTCVDRGGRSIAAGKRKSYRTVCLRDACMFGSVLIHGHVISLLHEVFLQGSTILGLQERKTLLVMHVQEIMVFFGTLWSVVQ